MLYGSFYVAMSFTKEGLAESEIEKIEFICASTKKRKNVNTECSMANAVVGSSTTNDTSSFWKT